MIYEIMYIHNMRKNICVIAYGVLENRYMICIRENSICMQYIIYKMEVVSE